MSSHADVLAIKLHEAAEQLCSVLDTIGSAASTPPLTPQQMSDLLSQLMQAGQSMRGMVQPPDEALAAALSDYRTQVERLRALLPSIHSALLQERARLAHEQERLRSIDAWAQASQQTLPL